VKNHSLTALVELNPSTTSAIVFGRRISRVQSFLRYHFFAV
jgi:hypothetical protein